MLAQDQRAPCPARGRLDTPGKPPVPFGQLTMTSVARVRLATTYEGGMSLVLALLVLLTLISSGVL